MEYLVIIIPHVKGKSLIRSVLTSIKRFPPNVDHKVVVIDNECYDNSIQYAKKKFPWIKLIRITKNIGFGAVLNVGIRAYRAKYYLILSDDLIIFEKNWFQKLLKLAESSEKNGIISPFYIDISKAKYFRDRKLRAKNEFKPLYPLGLTAATLLIKREVFDKIGLFEELFFPSYFEDIDFSQRALKAGYRLLKDPNTVFLHYHGVTSPAMYHRFYAFYAFYKARLIYDLLNTKKRRFPTMILAQLKYLLHIFLGILQNNGLNLIPGLSFSTFMAYLRTFNILHFIIQKRKNRKIFFDYKKYRNEEKIPFIKYLVWLNPWVLNRKKNE